MYQTESTLAPSSDRPDERPRVGGKFIFLGDLKLHVKGVTYGTFGPGEDGIEFPEPEVAEEDFRQMAASGLNALRTYTVPPRWLLDAAQRHGLRVMVGLPWEQHIAFLEDAGRAQAIVEKVRAGVRACARHPAVLCYAIGNEIPAPIVRWYGARRVERFLKQLYLAAKAEDPAGLVTYVNYPSTEYLQLPFLDFVCFNVYLESQADLEAYLARLHNLAGDRPLVLAEVGLDSRRNGEITQARVLDWQVRTAFAGGCAGLFLFAWTDEWHRSGYDIEDWDFGLTRRDRTAKPALLAVRAALRQIPFPSLPWPRISVVVCTHNGARTLEECLEGLERLEYPDFEVIVVDDGSTDDSAAIARRHRVRLISTENWGLASARNTGMKAATGEIVAYLDDDAYPDRDWLTYLAAAFLTTSHAGIGGPNIPPPGDGPIATCVANAPGGPVHVLLSDREAEHIPGCNMAFRKSCLENVGGFDVRYRAAGDDVDLCWRLQEKGWTLGFCPAAFVWHHRRDSIRAYWKQQRGYGSAEALLEENWPERYNALGHVSWTGRVYGNGLTRVLGGDRHRIYQGTWGSAPFQSVYQRAPDGFWSLTLMPEWYLIIAALAGLAALGALWRPLLGALPLFLMAVSVVVGQAILSAVHATFPDEPGSSLARWRLLGVTALLHLLQPTARLHGRVRYGLTPWRWRGNLDLVLPSRRIRIVWREEWQEPDEQLRFVEAALRARNAAVFRGGDFDRWDLEVRGGMLGSMRTLMAIEEHGAGRQLFRFRLWPRLSVPGLAALLLLAVLSVGAAVDSAPAGALALGAITTLLLVRAIQESAAAASAFESALDRLEMAEDGNTTSQLAHGRRNHGAAQSRSRDG